MAKWDNDVKQFNVRYKLNDFESKNLSIENIIYFMHLTKYCFFISAV